MTNSAATPLTVDLAEQLIRRMTDGLVNIVDKDGEFLLHRESPVQLLDYVLIVSGSRGWLDHRYQGLGRLGVDARRR